MKQAMELAVLYDVDVGLMVFGPSGVHTAFSSGGSSIDDILERYARSKHNVVERMTPQNVSLGVDCWFQRLINNSGGPGRRR